MNPKTLDELYTAVEKGEIISAFTKEGDKHRFFISTTKQLCRFKARSSRKGMLIHNHDFENYSKFIGVVTRTKEQILKSNYAAIVKYKRMAEQASFTNQFIKDCKAIPTFAEWQKEAKSLYELGITTGNKIDSKVISLDRIEKQFPHGIECLRNAIRNQTVGRHIFKGKFDGYDISVSTERNDWGFYGYLSLEFAGTGNGYYYLLINDENFIGYDVD